MTWGIQIPEILTTGTKRPINMPWVGDYKEIHDNIERMVLRQRLKRAMVRQAKKYEKRMKAPPPRYDDVFFEGVKWLDSL